MDKLVDSRALVSLIRSNIEMTRCVAVALEYIVCNYENNSSNDQEKQSVMMLLSKIGALSADIGASLKTIMESCQNDQYDERQVQ